MSRKKKKETLAIQEKSFPQKIKMVVNSQIILIHNVTCILRQLSNCIYQRTTEPGYNPN